MRRSCIDDKSGQVLHEDHADEPRHPASLTKIMTLYLLFEQLEAGTLKLDTPLPISTQAAIQNPTKLGLKANQTIKVEDAIKGLVTKSANDAAVVIAEALGGSEEEFAKLMTLKARMLGMSSTTYVNASGLPADGADHDRPRPGASRSRDPTPVSRSTTNISRLRASCGGAPRCATTTTCWETCGASTE